MADVLYKFCRKEHNLALEGTTVRIGNLNYYRAYEDQEIGDIQEGVKSYEGNIDTQEALVNFHHMSPFNLIFSATMDPNTGLAEYDSCYKINDPVKFSQILAFELLENIRLKDVTGIGFDEFETQEQVAEIGVEIERRKMNYLREDEITEEHYKSHHIPFWKSIRYSPQQEFRFLFKFFVGNHPAFSSTYLDFVDLDLSKKKNELPIEICY